MHKTFISDLKTRDQLMRYRGMKGAQLGLLGE